MQIRNKHLAPMFPVYDTSEKTLVAVDVPKDAGFFNSPSGNRFFDFFEFSSIHILFPRKGEKSETAFRGAPDAAMSSKERSQSIPSSSGRRERKSRAEMTPQRPESKRSGRSGSKEFVRGGGGTSRRLLLPCARHSPPERRSTTCTCGSLEAPRVSGQRSRRRREKFKRDDTLNGYIERLRDVEALCDLATSRTTQAGLSVPAPLEEFHRRKDEVLRCVNEMKDLPGSQQILGGKVSDEMFRELRYTGKRLDEYNQIPIDPLTSMLGSAGLAGWLASDKKKSGDTATRATQGDVRKSTDDRRDLDEPNVGVELDVGRCGDATGRAGHHHTEEHCEGPVWGSFRG